MKDVDHFITIRDALVTPRPTFIDSSAPQPTLGSCISSSPALGVYECT
jgi:hypothetical protein